VPERLFTLFWATRPSVLLSFLSGAAGVDKWVFSWLRVEEMIGMIKGISSMAVVVSDAAKAKKWYKEKLGFEVLSEAGHWVTVAPKGSKGPVLHLCQTTPLEEGNTGILFRVDDLNKAYEELTQKGVEFTKKPKDDGWGPYAMFKDPDGNVFWLEPE
jgi:catechol 2,3-dioxygenase-like lactoylglutathione lyase family enzyme